MYSREMVTVPEKIIQNRKPVFGTFKGHPHNLDIREVFLPYGTLPLPTVITNLNIKSRLTFSFQLDEYIGFIEIYDAKIMGRAEVCFWNVNTKQCFCYHSMMGPRKRFIPHNLDYGQFYCHKKSRYLRICWDRNHQKLSVIFNLKGKSSTPTANAALIACLPLENPSEITFVNPAPTLRRCVANYFTALNLHGAVSLFAKNSSVKTMPDSNGACLFDITRSYTKFRTSGEILSITGLIEGKLFVVRLSNWSQDAIDRDTYNSNVLFYDGKTTPLPPVTITHPYGINKTWIIQDTENMVDLTYTPLAANPHTISALIFHTRYNILYGTFDGALLTKDGEKIQVQKMPGLAKKYLLRM